jgi:hypothetical protein
LLRLFTFGFPTSTNPRDIRFQVDEGALAVILVKRILQMMIVNGTPAAAADFAKDSPICAFLKSAPQFTFALFNSRFLKCDDPRGVDQKLCQIIQLRSYGIVSVLLFCYPRLTSVEDGSLKLLNRASFGESLMVLHTTDSVYIWASSEEKLQNETGMAGQGVIDIELIHGAKADEIRRIVRSAWELSLQYLIVLPLVGPESVLPFLVDEKGTDEYPFRTWMSQGFGVARPGMRQPTL